MTVTKRIILAALAVAAYVAWRKWRPYRIEAEPVPETIDVPGVGTVQLETDPRKRDWWRNHFDRLAREGNNGRLY